MNLQEAREVLQAILDEFTEGEHAWVDMEDGRKGLGVWRPAQEGVDLELWPWKGDMQPYAPCFTQSHHWGRMGSWEENLADVIAYFWHWSPHIDGGGFMGFKPKAKKKPVEISFLGGKLVDPD